MDIFQLTKVEKSKVMADAVLIAYAVMAIQGRVEDEVSANEAYRLYDRGWIKDRTKRGLLHFTRKGATDKSAKIYSRFEIESLKRAEKSVTEAFEEARAKSGELSRMLLKNL
mgnify:CR=1 FL=1